MRKKEMVKKAMQKRNNLAVLFIFLITILGCKAAEESTSVGGDGSEFTLNCGVVRDGSVSGTVTSEDGTPIRIDTVSGANQVIYYEEDDLDKTLRLLKLQGISGSESGENHFAIEYLRNLVGGRMFLYLANDECEAVVDGGGVARVGTIINGNGESINEELIRSGFVTVEPTDACSVDQISGCLSALKESSPITAGELSEFLWKPVSDSDGRLAVHSSPSGTTIIVNGETGSNQGGGNGFGSLARFSQPGCSYGSARVQVIDGDSGLPYSLNGSTTLTIPNGCQRTCLTAGALVACS